VKRISLVFVIALALLSVTACGSATSAATQPPTEVAATQPPTQAAATEAPATSGNATQVDVTLADNTIKSSLTSFQVGVPYTFVITNTGRRGHNFNISTPVSEAGSLDAALQTALLAIPQTQLGPGANVTVEYTFSDSAAGQNLEFACLIRMHYQMGMLLPITVSQ
jgi:uncharacterized cupredoxin-like copper-binding protein